MLSTPHSLESHDAIAPQSDVWRKPGYGLLRQEWLMIRPLVPHRDLVRDSQDSTPPTSATSSPSAKWLVDGAPKTERPSCAKDHIVA